MKGGVLGGVRCLEGRECQQEGGRETGRERKSKGGGRRENSRDNKRQ